MCIRIPARMFNQAWTALILPEGWQSKGKVFKILFWYVHSCGYTY